MKNFIILITSVLLLSSINAPKGISELINAIKAGNASSIAKYFDNTVEITLSGKSNSYSKTQGEAVLKDFFTNNPVKSFTVVHKGESGGSKFCIGTLVTANGSFRTTVNLKQKGDREALQEIKFEK